jgi:hypothetical protein
MDISPTGFLIVNLSQLPLLTLNLSLQAAEGKDKACEGRRSR